MANPWDADEVLEQPTPQAAAMPWEQDEIVEGPGAGGMEIDITGGTPVSMEEFERAAAPVTDMASNVGGRIGSGISNAVGPIVSGGDDMRGLGLGARSVIQGAGGLLGTFGGDAFNAYIASPLERLLTGRDVKPRSYRDLAGDLSDTLGLPAPQNTRERVLGGIGEFATGAGLTLGAGSAAAGSPLASALLPTTLRGNVAQGVSIGALQPTDNTWQQAINAGGGGVLGAAGFGLGRVFSTLTPESGSAVGQAERIGLNLRAEPGEQVQQLSGAARNLVPESRGDAMLEIQQGVRNARDSARRGVNSAYDTARSSSATVPISEVGGFAANARRNLSESGFDVEAMPGVSKRLTELEELTSIPNARAAQLRALEGWRKRINAMSPKDGSPEMAASSALKRQYDDFMTDMFNKDMISGDAQALNAWRNARDAASRFQGTFNANSVIRNLAQKEDMTPETMRSWLFNASGSGAKTQAGEVIRRLDNILGTDSPQMIALRAEVVADLVDPLLQRTPNIRQFLDRNDKYFRNNPTLARTLFKDGVGDLQQIQAFARGVEKRPGARISPDAAPEQRTLWGPLGRLLTAKFFGHGIAEGGARMQAARGWIDRLRSSTVGAQAKRNILREYLGADPTQPMFPGTGLVGAGNAPYINAEETETP